jgi:two-component sensor histidine kinase
VGTYSVPSGRIRLETSLGAVRLPLDLAVPCGLILNELITNAAKHAFPGDRTGVITLTLSGTDDRCVISVADDGVGLPQGVRSEGPVTLGLRLITLLANQVNGRFELTSAPSGTTARLTLTRAVNG